MRNLLLLLLPLTLPKLVEGQNSLNYEISVGLTTLDKSVPYGHGHFADSLKLQTGIFNDKSYGAHVIIKVHHTNSTAFRLKTQYMVVDLFSSSEPFWNNFIMSELSVNQKIWRFSPGFQWQIKKERLNFFSGLELPITYIGTSYFYSGYNSTAPIPYSHIYRRTVPGGFSVGAGFFFGSSFHLNKFLTIGFELNGNYSYTSAGGQVATDYRKNYNGFQTHSFKYYTEYESRLGFSAIQANFSLGFNF